MENNFPAVANPTDMAARLANSKVNTNQATGGAFLKFDFNTGEFSAGRDNDDVTDELVLINTQLISHGWIAWADNKAQKLFRPFDEDLPIQPAPLTDSRGKTKDFSEARLMVGAFVDDGEMFTYENNSYGCVKGVSTLLSAILAKATDGTANYYPKVKLTSESYAGSGERSGKTNFNPIFEVVAWCDIDGNEEGEAPAQIAAEPAEVEPEVEPEVETETMPEAEAEAPQPRQRRKRKANAAA